MPAAEAPAADRCAHVATWSCGQRRGGAHAWRHGLARPARSPLCARQGQCARRPAIRLVRLSCAPACRWQRRSTTGLRSRSCSSTTTSAGRPGSVLACPLGLSGAGEQLLLPCVCTACGGSLHGWGCCGSVTRPGRLILGAVVAEGLLVSCGRAAPQEARTLRERCTTGSQRRGSRLPRKPHRRRAALWSVWTACKLAGVIGVRSAVRRARRRWGSKVSPKLFVAKEYVLKHIRLKHADKVDAQRERVRAGSRARAKGQRARGRRLRRPRLALRCRAAQAAWPVGSWFCAITSTAP